MQETLQTIPLKKVSEFCGRLLVLRAVLREMLQLSTFETTGAREEVIHLSQLWATMSIVRSMSRLVSPASVETIALQLQSNLLVVFRTTALASFLG